MRDPYLGYDEWGAPRVVRPPPVRTVIVFEQPVTFSNGESIEYTYGPDGQLAEIRKTPSGESIPFHVESRTGA